MNLLLGPALRLILSSTNLGSLDITVLHKRSSADLNSLVESNLLVFNETALSVVLLALLLLLGLVVGDIGGVAPPVIGVVALDDIVVLGLFDHLHLVNAPLAISARTGSSNSRETHIGVVSLTLSTGLEGLNWLATMILPMVTMVAFVMGSMVLALLGVEGECSEKVPALPSVAAELASTQCTAGEKAQCQCQLGWKRNKLLLTL